MKTITEQLYDYIEAIEEDINKDKFCTLVFKVKDGKVIRFEKIYSVNLDEIKIEITD